MFAVKNEPFVRQSPKKPKTSFRFWWLILLFIGIVGSIYLAVTAYEETINKNESGEIVSISEQQKVKFLADSLKLTQCVQYALVAKSDGWYEKCDGSGKVFLYIDEVWKYGTTCKNNPESRYSSAFYGINNVKMLTQFVGNSFECEVAEKRRLYEYPILPENLKRKVNERLILPPGNCKLK